MTEYRKNGPNGSGREPLVWATIAGGSNRPMGLQHYEVEVLQALRGLSESPWRFDLRPIGGLRSAAPLRNRIPRGRLETAATGEAIAYGRYLFGRARCVHRFDLRLPPHSGPEVVTVHDLPPLRFDDEGVLPRWAVETSRRARLAICPSTFAADEVRELLGIEETTVVPNGVSPSFAAASPLSREEVAALGIDGRFIVHIGGATARKNLSQLAEAWRLLGRLAGLTLVLVGPPDARRDAAFAGLAGVVKLGYRSTDDVARIMRTAEAVVVPSMYEGFGLPALEAMAAGTPVVSSNRGALPEVCGDAALLVEPTGAAIAEAVGDILRDVVLSHTLRLRGRERASRFTWERTAQGHLEAYDRAFVGTQR